MTIDEEIHHIIKGMDHDYSRLKKNLYGFQEIKGEEYKTYEYLEREAVAEQLNETNTMF